MTEQNNDEDFNGDAYNFDEKEFYLRSSMINKKKKESGPVGDE